LSELRDVSEPVRQRFEELWRAAIVVYPVPEGATTTVAERSGFLGINVRALLKALLTLVATLSAMLGGEPDLALVASCRR
jgi:hypothetical protein